MSERLSDAELESAVEDCAFLDGIDIKIRVKKLVAEIRRLRAENAAMREAVQERNGHVDRLLAELDEPRGYLAPKNLKGD